MEKLSGVLRKLTYDDLREWAGSKLFSRGKSYIKNVGGLFRMEDGTLAAWVSGSEEYATSVRLDPDGDIEYFCTCPYDWGPCKHAVAVVLAAAELAFAPAPSGKRHTPAPFPHPGCSDPVPGLSPSW